MTTLVLIAFALAALGAVALGVAALLLRSLGPRYRVGRLLAVAPEVSISEVHALAAAGEPRYVRVAGRISSEEEFPDENDRPLVYRRRRIELATRGRWRTVHDDREAVAFGLERRSDYLALDAAALDEGLVVVAREAVGRVTDLPADLRADLVDGGEVEPDTPARLVVEQVSAVEHAVAAGVPRRDDDGSIVLGAGLGRPLIVSTVEVPAAMRVLARDSRRRVLAAAGLLVAGVGLLGAALVAFLVAR